LNYTTPSLDAHLAGCRILLVAALLWTSPGVSLDGPYPEPGQAAAGVVQGVPVTDTIPEILARVNGEPITRNELRRIQADLLELGRQQQPGNIAPDGEELRSSALQQLFQRRLVLQEARRQQLTVTGQELDQAVSALRNRFADLKAFGVWMQERGLDDRSLFDTLRDDLLVARCMAALVESVEVTGQQVHDYYASRKDDLTIGEEVRLRIIVVGSEAAAREILAALRAGENFSRLARQRSLGLRAAQGGDTGWVNTRTLPPALRNSVALLRPGDASHPVQKAADEFLIVGLQGRRGMQAKNLDEARPVIERRLLAARQQEAVQTWLQEQEQQAQIEVFPPLNDPQMGDNMIRNDQPKTLLQVQYQEVSE